jgi:restriction system protein
MGRVEFFMPLIKALRELGGSGSPEEVADRIAEDLKLSDEIQNDLLNSGEPRYRNLIRWARLYLVREGFIDSSKFGIWRLTPAGWQASLSSESSKKIYQKWNRAFLEERKAKNKLSISADLVSGESEPNDEPGNKIIEILRSLSPTGFERFTQLLLRSAGFTQVVVVGKSGDGGIDGYGILQVNEFISFKVYFQCKRYSGTVPVGQLRDFRGAMSGRSDKGVFLTTGTFTTEARREASREGVPPIEMIDAERLVAMLKKYKLGLRPVEEFEIDDAFFEPYKV